MHRHRPDILLAICPPWGIVHPPLGLAYLATNLKRNGFRAAICDLNLDLYRSADPRSKELWKIENDHIWRDPHRVDDFLRQREENVIDLLKAILDSRAPVIGFSIVDPNEYITSRIIKALKQKCPDPVIIAGGPGCASPGQRRYLLNASGSAIDYFVLGEGEITLVALLRALSSGDQAIRIPGVVPADAAVNLCASSPRLDLGELFFPTLEEFNLPDYGQQSLAVMWSRGCIGRCVYCKEQALWGKYRPRPVASIIDELHHHVGRYGVQDYVIYDSAVNGNGRHLGAVCDAIIASPLKFTWSAEAIPLPNLDAELLEKMARAGCHTLVFGIESGSDGILRRMGKLNRTRTAEKVLKCASAVGIKVAVNIMIGFPGENRPEFEETLDFLRRNRSWIDRLDGISTVQIVNDTTLMQQAVQLGVRFPRHNPHNRWYTLDGNTITERQKRLQIVIELAHALGFEIGRTFLETESPSILDSHHINHQRPPWRRWLDRLFF